MHIIPLLLCSINKTIFFRSFILFFSVRINQCDICATRCLFPSPCPLVPPTPAIVKDPKPPANHVVARQRMQPMRMAKTTPWTQRADVSNGTHSCYDPPQFFSSLSDPLLVTLSMPKRPLPLNPSSLPDLPPLPPSEPSKLLSPLDQPPVEPLVPIPWNIHRWEYSSMEEYQEPSPVGNPLEDPDSPMEDAPPLEPQPVTHYEPDVPGGQTHTLSPEESPIEPWAAYLTQPSSPVPRKHSLSPTSSSSAPIRQRTSREGSYQSITPPASSPIAGTSPQSQGYQSTSLEGSADNPSSTQSSADDADSKMALNWVTINTDYLKG